MREERSKKIIERYLYLKKIKKGSGMCVRERERDEDVCAREKNWKMCVCVYACVRQRERGEREERERRDSRE